jgi:drug/metabolite transporter (DMT)-like permease
MAASSVSGRTRVGALVAGFATLYLVWGSTYLGIKFAVETLPPFLMAGWRFMLAGSVLYLWLRLRGAARPTLRQWASAVVGGALLLLGGNGLVTWAQQQSVPSGVAALIGGTTPIWMVLVSWLFDHGPRPGIRVVLGMSLGFTGVILLLQPRGLAGQAPALLPLLAVLSAPVLWAVGSVYSRRAGSSASTLLASAMQMLAGGGLMLAAGSFKGEWSVAANSAFSLRSLLAFAYLTLVGSLVGFSTYIWLLRKVSAGAVSTHCYVNPLVAVFLGWLLGNETLHPNTLLAAGLIVGAVVLITLARTPLGSPARVRLPQREPVRWQPTTSKAISCTPGNNRS